MKYFKLTIPDELHTKFKAHCVETGRSMQALIVDLMANEVNNGNKVNKVDTVNTANTVNMLAGLKILIEGLDNKLESLDNRLDKVEKNSGIDPDYQPEILEPGHKLITFHLTQRLTDYQKSIGKRSVGRGSLKINRDQNKDNMNAHREWLKKRDPQGLYWDWNEEEKIYTASVD